MQKSARVAGWRCFQGDSLSRRLPSAKVSLEPWAWTFRRRPKGEQTYEDEPEGREPWEDLRKENRPENAADFEASFPKVTFVKSD